MVEKDKNNDGKIDLNEYLDDMADDVNSDWYDIEKTRFEETYDKDKNGILEGDEITHWLVLNLNTTAEEVSSTF